MFLRKEAGLYGSIEAALRANMPHGKTPCPRLYEFASRWLAGYVIANGRPSAQNLHPASSRIGQENANCRPPLPAPVLFTAANLMRWLIGLSDTKRLS